MEQVLAGPGTVLAGRYTVERELGRGGMAMVYLATEVKHQRKVAIKVLKPDLAVSLGTERFLREIAITAQLTHPNILTLIDSGEANGIPFYVLPFVEGESLRQRLDREKQLPLREAVRIGQEIADALSYAHARDIVHRDIKPDNILLEAGHAVVSDFGIARAIRVAGGEALTEAGIALGTPLYMSPEQGAGDLPLDGRSDIYSLGCIVYEMLTGQPPFTGATAKAVVARKCVEPVPGIRTVRPAVPVAIEHAVIKALAALPADRFQTASDFADALAGNGKPTPMIRAAGLLPGIRRLLPGLLAGTLLLGGAWWALDRSSNIDSLAVLPVQNVSGDSTPAYLMDAMHGAIIAELGHVERLRTISQWSASRYRNTKKSIRQIAQELGVDAIVQPSVSTRAGRIRVQLQLVRAVPEERQLWAYTYDGSLGEVLSLQSEVARDIAQQLRISLSPQESARLGSKQAIDPEAYDAYARGRFVWNTFTADGFKQAIDYFGKAIQKSPSYALAYAGLADAYNGLPYYAAVNPGEAFPKAKAAAIRALELDETLAEPHTALGWTAAAHDWNWSEAEQHFRKALELRPSYAVGHLWYAWFLAWEGRFNEAIAEDLRARELDPLSPRILAHLGVVHHMARRYDRAAQLLRETVALYPGFARARWDLGRLYFDLGRYSDALAEFQQAMKLAGQSTVAAATSVAELAKVYAKLGRRDEAFRILRRLESERARRYVPATTIAHIYVALDDKERALHWLELAYNDRDADLVLLKILPLYDPLRSDARFGDLLRRVGFRLP